MNTLLSVDICGIGVVGPGLTNWAQAAPLLRGEQPFEPTELPPLKPELLPPNERRRTTQLIKLAIQAAEEAQRHSGIEAAQLACVFASAEGDTFIVDRLCEALALPEKPVSPTQFHNSVHNAPAGYWAIAGVARRFSTSIAAAGASFTAGLLEAAAFVASEGEPVLLVAYDIALPETLAPFGDSHSPFAVALVLASKNQGGSRLASLGLISPQEGSVSAMLPTAFSSLQTQNAAAQALPLLSQLARGESATVNLAYHDGTVLALELTC